MAQLCVVLLWKTFVLRKRRYIITLLEVVVPILMFWLFVHFKNLLPQQTGRIAYDSWPSQYNDLYRGNYKIAYAPSNLITDAIMRKALENMENHTVRVTLVSKNNEEEVVGWLREQYINETYSNNSSSPWYIDYSVGVGVIFSNPGDSSTLTYTLRTTKGDLETSEDTIYGQQTISGFYEYYSSGFLTVQSSIDSAYLSTYYNINATSFNILIENLPYIEVMTFDLLTVLLPFFIMVGFNFVKPSLLRGIVEEKSSGIKELQVIMGLKPWINWLGWMVYGMVIYVPVTFVITVLLTTDSGSGSTINANFFIVWILFLLFAVAFVMLVFAISTFFTNGTIAVISGLIIWYVVSIVLNSFFIAEPDKFGLWLNLITCLWPSVCLQWCLQTISNFDKNGHTWTLRNLFEDGAGGGRVSVGLAAIMFLVEILFYGVITWYMDNIKPGPYGRAKPLSFIFQCFKKEEYDSSSAHAPFNQDSYEAPPRGVKVGIKIESLRKTFNNGKVVAVENVDLDVYEGNITALLGHNGAGKSTTMSMIAGFFSPTRGRVVVKDKNIFDNMDQFRSSLGLCPQYNLLFSYFTVLEHLIFFGMLKGLRISEAEQEGMQLLRTFKIDAKKNDLVSKLSGGMKRKLCLCIALMGDPEVLMLDEPTSGLDPESRRQVWDVLLGFRGQRTTIITTHFMEEADVLGDRIAIMDHGQVSCYGTTLFLKKLYGTGYHLNISKLDQAPVAPITRVVEQYVTSGMLQLSSPSQLSYNIKSEESAQFPALFSALDSWRTELGLTSISINCTTMEDVFLRVAEEPESHLDTNVHMNGEHMSYKYKKVTGCGLMLQQFKALVTKRLLTRLRSWMSTLMFIILPVLLTAYTMRQTMKSDFRDAQPSLMISLANSPNVHVAVSADNATVSSVLQRLVASGKASYDAIPEGSGFDSYFADQIKQNLIQYEREMIAGFKFNSSVFIGGYSRYFRHSTPIVYNLIANTLLQLVSPSSSITIHNHPLVFQSSQDACELYVSASIHVFNFPQRVIFLSLGLLILTMSFISFPLKERVSSSKQLQLMSGVSPLLYWLVIILCDFVMYLITVTLCIATVFVFQTVNIYSASGYMGTLIGLFALFGISGITFAHFFSFFVRTSVKAAAIFIKINLITGTFAAVFLIYMGQVFLDYDIYRYLLCFNPVFAVTYAFSNLLSAMYIDGTCIQCGNNCKTQDPLQFFTSGQKTTSPYGILDFVIFLVIDAVLYFVLVMMIEYGLIKKFWFLITKTTIKMNSALMEEDSDVLIEREKITSTQSLRGYIQNTSVLCVNNLGKKYNRKSTAVYGVTFQVGQGECFGLLGVNGAGKTTTFKMLTGEEIPNKGDASILQCSLNKNKSKFLSRIGYCPQFDAISPLLTGKEMLQVYARLRGIPSSHLDAEVSRWIQMMGLREYANRPCGTYSGGNKRKLSTAMAFIGSPPVVFLDEPTSGVDPVSRRKLWDIVSSCQSTGQAIVLTSHSMEECEALCSRLTIMVAGEMKCIGSVQHLKQKFGQGYTIKIKLFSSSRIQNAVSRLKYDMANQFRECSVKDEHWGLLHYHIRDSSIRLSELFMKMEHLKRTHDIIEDYVVSDTTLEQVFMSFAQPQSETQPS